MLGESDGFDWVDGGLKKLAEAAIVGLVGLAAAKLGLAPAKDITDPQNWPLWAALVLLFAAYQLGFPPLRRAYLRSRVPRANPNKISILLAWLNQDKSHGSLREIVREALVRELGDAVEVILWPEALRVGEGRYAEANIHTRSKAQKWLKAKSCDLLIWGRVKGDKTIALRFTPAEGSDSDMRSYGLTADTLELPLGFVSDLGAALAARIVVEAARAVHMSGHYLVPLMRASAERLGPIAQRPNPSFDARVRGSVLHSYALVRQTIGEQAGSNDDLLQAIAAYRDALKEWTRERVPLEWATIENSLGNALSHLGERESSTARLEEAVTAYRDALKEWTRERVPLNWAMTQSNLGDTLRSLGERESGTARLGEAVAAFRDALQEYTRDRVPLRWATIQNNLGVALSCLGERESGTERLEEAVAAHREALKEYTRERVPLDWAMTQNNLGGALTRLGEREGITARFEEAVAAYRDASQEYTRERVPLRWASTQNNLGTALRSLGERETGTARLEEAVVAFRAALDEATRERAPLDWAMTQNNLGTALATLGARESGTARLEEAVASYRDALAVFEAAGAEYYIDRTRRNLADAEVLLAKRRAKGAR
jgi:tetratricopeptide (TPR) repeat protein